MKTWKDITYERLLDEELISYCYTQASKGKRNRKSVQKMSNKEEQLKLLAELKDGTYRPMKCRKMTRWDKNAKKNRDISCPAFRDQMAHWAIVTLLKQHFEQTFIKHNIANIPGRGLSYGNLLLRHWARQRGTKYVLKMDIRKFYPSISVPILVNKLKAKVRDKKFIALIELFLYTESPSGIGLSLGSYLNLWLALYFLDGLDHIIKERFKVKFYLRYVDDILILTKTKREAQKLFKFIKDYLSDIGLEVKESGHGKAKIYKWTKERFVDMLGTKTYRNKQVLRGHVYLNVSRQLNRVRRNGKDSHLARSILSYKGTVQHSSCLKFYHEIERTIEVEHLKEVAGL